MSQKGGESTMSTRDRTSAIPASRPQSTASTAIVAAPVIEAINANAAPNAKTNGHHHSLLGRHKHEQGGDKADRTSIGSVKKKTTSATPGRHSTDSDQQAEKQAASTALNGPDLEEQSELRVPTAAPILAESQMERPEQELKPIAHNKDHTEERPPLGHPHQPPRQDVRLPASITSPGNLSMEPGFPSLQERKHQVSLLVQIWLFIAGLYTRTSAFEDAKGAIDEAFKLVEELELDLSHQSSTAKAFAEPGWGGGESVEQLWADVYAGVSQTQCRFSGFC